MYFTFVDDRIGLSGANVITYEVGEPVPTEPFAITTSVCLPGVIPENAAFDVRTVVRPVYLCEESKNGVFVVLFVDVSTGVTGLSSIKYEKDAVLPVAVTSMVKLLDVTPVALVIVGVPMVGAGGGVDTTKYTGVAEPDGLIAVTLKI